MMTFSQLKSNIPLYSDLAGLVLEFLEPCVDYDVPKCTHIQCVGCNRHVGEIRQGGGVYVRCMYVLWNFGCECTRL